MMQIGLRSEQPRLPSFIQHYIFRFCQILGVQTLSNTIEPTVQCVCTEAPTGHNISSSTVRQLNGLNAIDAALKTSTCLYNRELTR